MNCDETAKNLNGDKLENWNGDKTQQLKLWHNSKTQVVTKLKNSNFEKTQMVTKLKLWQNLNCD